MQKKRQSWEKIAQYSRLCIQVPRFALVGLAATAVHFTILTGLVEIARLPWPTAASVIGSVFGIATSYLGNYRWTFARTEPHREFVSRFVFTYLATMAGHAGIMYLLIDGFGFRYPVAFAVGTSISTATNFGLAKILVFERKRASVATPQQATTGCAEYACYPPET